ncbi:MAG: cupin domain-containing protein [Gemmatimonadetes bacterium]|nr:cupin domain-containing protein [Gemmatimonadota bacterium]
MKRSRRAARSREHAPGTAIFYLHTTGTFSALHRLPGDEVFHFYLGDPVEMLMLFSDGRHERVVLGPDVERMSVQHVVPGGTWQGSRLIHGGGYALLGTTMAPGFDFKDYDPGTRELVGQFPACAALVEALLPSSR